MCATHAVHNVRCGTERQELLYSVMHWSENRKSTRLAENLTQEEAEAAAAAGNEGQEVSL
jgi:hypothetical protein